MQAPRAALVAVGLAAGILSASAAGAANPMGYRLMPADRAASLPPRHGALGLQVGRAKQMNEDGLTFETLRIQSVRAGSAGALAGFTAGDEIVAVDGLVFPSIAAFAAYIGSLGPGGHAVIDFIPAGGGPAQVRRQTVAIGGG